MDKSLFSGDCHASETSEVQSTIAALINHQPGLHAAPITAEQLRRMIPTWADLSLDRRRGLDSAIKRVVEIVSVDGTSLLLACESLNAKLFSRPPAAYGLTSQRFGNVVSSLRVAMRRVGACDPDVRGADKLNASWRALRQLLPEYRDRTLATFMGFCSAHNIDPNDVGQPTLEAFETWLRTRTLTDGIPKLVRETASNWTWAAANVAGWPQGIIEKPGMRRFYTLPLTDYSTAFQEDIERYLSHLAGTDDSDPFADDPFADGPVPHATFRGRRGYAAERTVTTRRYHLRQAAAALVLDGGMDPQGLTTIRDLVTPIERAKVILNFYFSRAKKQATTQTGGIYELLRQIAVYEARVSPADLARFKHWSQRVVPPPRKGMAEENRRRLIALLEPRTTGALLNLPWEMLKQIEKGKLTPMAAARVAAYAAALAILLSFPMRKDNLAKLQLTMHLKRLDPSSRRLTHIFLSASEVKGGTGFEWPLEAETAALVELYINKYRPLLAAPGNPFLFVGPGLKSRSAHELGEGLTSLVEKQLGVPINVHLMRHFGVAIYLRRNPGKYEVARQVLGHKKTSTTVIYYTGLEADAAARHFGESVLAERTQGKKLAAAVFAPKRRKKGAR